MLSIEECSHIKADTSLCSLITCYMPCNMEVNRTLPKNLILRWLSYTSSIMYKQLTHWHILPDTSSQAIICIHLNIQSLLHLRAQNDNCMISVEENLFITASPHEQIQNQQHHMGYESQIGCKQILQHIICRIPFEHYS